jgi:hypothetical protein
MMSRRIWTAVFLAATGVAVTMELVAGIFLPGPDRPAWTDLIVGSFPRAVVLPLAGVLAAWIVPHFVTAYRHRDTVVQAVPSTQAKHPGRAALRTAFAWLVGASPLLAEYLAGLHPGGPAILGQTLAFGTAVTRFLARPDVERWLAVYLPWLAPAPPIQIAQPTAPR